MNINPKAATAALITDSLVFMFFVLRFGFCFGFPAGLLFMPVHVLKRKDRLKPATTAQVFFIAFGGTVKIAWSC
jgi:hypothetical protein